MKLRTILTYIPLFWGLTTAFAAGVISPGLTLALFDTSAVLTTEFPGNTGGYNILLMTLTGDQLKPTDYDLGFPSAWFVANRNDAIDASYALTHAAFASNMTASLVGRAVIPLNSSLFLAYWRDTNTQWGNGESPVPNQGDQFGWAELTHTTTGLVLTASATDTSGYGLAVGTYTSIPEPSSISMVVGLFMLVGVIVRRYQSRTELTL